MAFIIDASFLDSEGDNLMQENNNNWDTDYEWKVVFLLALGFGLVGMDRFVIGTLWPTISGELGLDPGAIGNLHLIY